MRRKKEGRKKKKDEYIKDLKRNTRNYFQNQNNIK